MLEANMFLQTHRYAEFFASGKDPPRMGSAMSNVVPDQAFATNDGYLAVSATNDEEWQNLCNALELPNLASDPKFATNDDRVKNRDELVSLLEAKLRTLPSWWWYKLFSRSGVPCGLYQSLEDVMLNSNVYANKFLVEMEIPIAGNVILGGAPFRFSRTPAKMVRPAIGVIPGNRPTAMYGQLDREKWPNGYPGEHTAIIKERYKKRQVLFVTTA